MSNKWHSLSNRSKLSVIRYPYIRYSHATGNNFKENLTFHKITSKIKLRLNLCYQLRLCRMGW
jgi:hypothetical protein